MLTASFALSSHPFHFHERATSSSSAPLPPSQDPFYTAPANYESAAPGTVLRTRASPGNLTSVIGNSSAAYNILYRTTDSLYNPSWAVTTLFIPLSSPHATQNASNSTDTGTALLSYQIPYDSADVDASPSYALSTSANNPLYASAYSDIPNALGRGWFVSVPDYEGPLAASAAGVESGHATIDSVRAVLSSNLGPAASNTRYAMWGYSGGALASEWAAELQVKYAPELNFSGAALGGLTPNISSVLVSVTSSLYAGLIPGGILGLTAQYPEAYKYIVSKLNPTGQYNRTTFLSAKNLSAVQALEVFADQNVFDYFVDGIADLQAPIIQTIFDNDGLMGYHGVPQMPVFAYKAIADELSNVTETDALVNKFCEMGANILYQRNTVGGHLAEETNGDARALEWLSSVLDGTYSEQYAAQGCTIENVTIDVTSSPE